MVFSLLPVFTSLFIFIFIVTHIQIFNFSSKFANGIVNLLLLVGAYSLYITHFKSIYIIPVLGILISGFVLKKISIRFDFSEWKTTILFTGFISLLFVLFFIRNGELLITHDDYLFWIRVGLANKHFGVENINVFYNLMNNSYKGADFYHHLELWTMDLGAVLNGQSASLNLFFFAYPIGLIISCFGIKELILSFLPEMSKKNNIVFFSVLFFIAGFLLFCQPWDAFNLYFGHDKMPISGMGLIWKSLKIIYVLNIILALFLYLRTLSLYSFSILLFVSFFYLPVLPIIFLALFLYMIYLYFSGDKTQIKNIVVLIFWVLGFVAFYLFLGNHSGTTISSFSLKEWLSFSGVLKYSPAILMKVVFIPLFGIIPFWYLYFKNKSYFLHSKYIYFIGLLYLICLSVWCSFVKNVDSNQAFLLIFGALLPLLVLATIWYYAFIKDKKWILFLLLVYILPGILNIVNFKCPINQDLYSTRQYVSKLHQNCKILYLPDPATLYTVYDFNERVYTGINQFILYNPNVDLISVSGAIQSDIPKNNPAIIEMYNFYRETSPYYKECGYLDTKSKCFTAFLSKYKIKLICSKNKKLNINGWHKDFENKDYCFYTTI